MPSTSVCSLFAQLAGDDEWLQDAAALGATATCHVRSSLTAAPKSAAISRGARHAPPTVKLPLQLHNYQAPPLTQVVISRNTPSSAFLSVINCSFDLSKTQGDHPTDPAMDNPIFHNVRHTRRMFNCGNGNEKYAEALTIPLQQRSSCSGNDCTCRIT